MSNKFLPIFIGNARHGNQKVLPRLLEARASPQEVLAFCQNHRLMGLGKVLMLCDTQALQSHFYQSGRAFLAYATRWQDSWPVGLSRAVPLFDALAAFDQEGARQLAALAPQAHQADIEYEEDFLYVRFLTEWGLLNASEARASTLLKRFEAALQGSEEPRLDVCKALLTHDAGGFEEALLEFLRAEGGRNVRLHEQQRLTAEQWATEAQISVEGLALLALAHHAGLRTHEDYPRVPSVARCRTSPRESPDSWKLGN